MKCVEISLTEETLASLGFEPEALAAELRLAAAAKWYELGRVSQEVGAQVAGMSGGEFLTALSLLQTSPMQESAEEALAGASHLFRS